MSENVFQQVNDFFEDYAKALAQMDSKRMAYLHSMPCSFVTDDLVSTFSDPSRLEGLFNQGVVFYKQFGLAHALPQVYSKHFLTERMATVKVVWQYLDERRRLIYDCDYHYTLRKDKEDLWKIAVTISINEKDRMMAWQDKNRMAYSSAAS